MVGMGFVGAPACGDYMKIYAKGDEMTRKIADACSKPFGCGLGVASSSMAAGWVKGKQMEGVSPIKNTFWGEMTRNSSCRISCSGIARHLPFRPFKLSGSMFAEDAINAGLKGREAKRALATATETTSGEKAATTTALMKNRLRPLSPHLSVYKPQSSSMSSIFNRISGASLAAMVLGFYVLCLKMPSICFTYADSYQFFQFSSNFSLICAQIAAFAISYHLYDGIRRLLH